MASKIFPLHIKKSEKTINERNWALYNDVLLLIFRSLAPNDLSNVCAVCLHWLAVGSLDQLWKDFYLNKYPTEDQIAKGYREKYCAEQNVVARVIYSALSGFTYREKNIRYKAYGRYKGEATIDYTGPYANTRKFEVKCHFERGRWRIYETCVCQWRIFSQKEIAIQILSSTGRYHHGFFDLIGNSVKEHYKDDIVVDVVSKKKDIEHIIWVAIVWICTFKWDAYIIKENGNIHFN